MKAKVKEMWVAALRSGDYEQTKGRLHDEFGWCCLGVLCDLADKNGVSLMRTFDDHDCTERFDHESTVLPERVVAWAGVLGGNPKVAVPEGTTLPLAYLNDSGASFSEIAHLIEENL